MEEFANMKLDEELPVNNFSQTSFAKKEDEY
jgi:hypothetical protein